MPVVYGGGEEVKAEESAPSPAAGTEETAASDDALSENEEMSLGELPPPPAETPEAVETNASANETRPTAEVEPEMPATAPTPVTAENVQPAAQPAAPVPVIEEKANVYVGPVEFNNNTHSAKPSQVLKDMFADTEGYRLVDNPGAAGYVFLPKVLKAKVDALNSQTKRIQMVVSLQLQVQNSSISFSEHQNRFVLFESGENEQEIAQKLLHKLLRKAGRKLFEKVEQAEAKRKAQGLPQIITPSK